MRDFKSMPTFSENDDYDKCLNNSSTFCLILRDRLRPMPNMYLPDINSISQRKPLVRNNSYSWINSQTSDESCSLSDCWSSCSQRSEGSTGDHHAGKISQQQKKFNVNKLVMPVRTNDKTVRMYVPEKARTQEQVENIIESKSSITRMMEEFHKNLPAAVNLKYSKV